MGMDHSTLLNELIRSDNTPSTTYNNSNSRVFDDSFLALLLEQNRKSVKFFLDCAGVFHPVRDFPHCTIWLELLSIDIPPTVDSNPIGVYNAVFVFNGV